MNRALINLILVFLMLPMAGAAQNAPATDVPFGLPVPPGWRTETILFPLDFAPDVPYSGLEELRFAPGMFKPGEPDFWTYAMVWWVAADAPTDGLSLQKYLTAYMRGLSTAVAEAQGLTPEGEEYRVQLMNVDREKHGVDMVGMVTTWDPFATHRNVTLYANVTRRLCRDQERMAVIFEFSPQAFGEPVRQDLVDIRAGFLCP